MGLQLTWGLRGRLPLSRLLDLPGLSGLSIQSVRLVVSTLGSRPKLLPVKGVSSGVSSAELEYCQG